MSVNFDDLSKSMDLMAKAWDTYSQYDALSNKYSSDARVYAGDYDLDMQSAEDAKKRGVAAVEAINRKTAIVGGRQRAAMGASGVEVGKGSFANLLSDNEEFGRQDADTAWQNALRESYGYETSARNALERSRMAGTQARDASDNGTLATLGSLASGIFDFGSSSGWW